MLHSGRVRGDVASVHPPPKMFLKTIFIKLSIKQEILDILTVSEVKIFALLNLF